MKNVLKWSEQRENIILGENAIRNRPPPCFGVQSHIRSTKQILQNNCGGTRPENGKCRNIYRAVPHVYVTTDNSILDNKGQIQILALFVQ